MNIARRKIITATAIAPIATAATISSVVAALVPSGIQATGLSPKLARHTRNIKDADLLSLGSELETNWAIQRQLSKVSPMDEERIRQFDIVYAALGKIAKNIFRLPATTLEGLQVKALAISWCHCGEVIDLDGETTDVQLANSIINDLLSIKKIGEQ